MPKGDRTGPMGAGAMSGRRAGYCAEFDRTGIANSASSAVSGFRRGRRCGGWGGPAAGGRGWRHWSFATGRMGRMIFSCHCSSPQSFNPELEKESLRNRSAALQAESDAINQRIAELDSQEKAP